MKISIRDFLKDPKKDEFFGFSKFFCKESSLENKAKSMNSKLRFLIKENLINQDLLSVEFQNDCLMNGCFFEIMKFSMLDKDVNLGSIYPKSAAFWTHIPESKEYQFKNWLDLKKQLVENEQLRCIFKKTFYYV